MSETETVIENPPVAAAETPAAEKPEEKRKDPNPRCKKCYGRGHIGTDTVHGGTIPCRCTYSEREEKDYRHRLDLEDNQKRLARK